MLIVASANSIQPIWKALGSRTFAGATREGGFPFGIEEAMKVCCTCKKAFELDMFHKNISKKDGLAEYCKACGNEASKRYRERHPERVAELQRISKRKHRHKRVTYKRNWEAKPENREKSRARARKNYRLDPEKYKELQRQFITNNRKRINASALFRKHVSLGKIIRPNECSHCKDSQPLINGHHPDYSKPFDVIWLCPSCHQCLHKSGKLPDITKDYIVARGIEDVQTLIEKGE